mgnify:FL=1
MKFCAERRDYMKRIIKKEYQLKGLNCADCANKIECEVQELNGISSASVNFLTGTLSVQISDEYNEEDILSRIKNIIKKHEPGVIVKDTSNAKNFDSKDMDIDNEDFASEKADIKEDDYTEDSISKRLVQLAGGIILYLAAILIPLSFQIKIVLFVAAYLIIGGEIVFNAARNVLKGQVFDENFLMSIATVGAFAIGEYPEAVGVMVFYQIGEFFQDMAVNRSRKSIAKLMDIRPDYANLKSGNEVKKVDPEKVKIGDIIIIKPGERVPLDGVVTEGESMLDTSALTGESVPMEIHQGDEILSGSINKNGLLSVKVTKEFKESTVSRILELVQNASGRKARAENFITKFARYYTPAVVITAVVLAILPPVILKGAAFSDWFYRALIFLVVSCPCALVISIPLSFFGGIGAASKKGILVKGSNYLEVLNNVDAIVFDKTGTLTKGIFKVTKVVSCSDIGENELLEYAALAESGSNHPIAVSLMKAYQKDVDSGRIHGYEEIAGHGVKAYIDGIAVIAGNKKMMESEGIEYKEEEAIGTILYISINGKYAGYIVISDEIKEDAALAVSELRKAGINKIIMLTGDNKYTAQRIGAILNIDEVDAELLPHQKVERFELLISQKSTGGKVMFVGDGLNDAPVLARADVGVAMGGIGSDAAIEAADIVLMTDEVSKLTDAISIAKKTRRIVAQNITLALIIKFAVLGFGAAGFATMWEAVFADVGVALLAVINAMRLIVNK